jgi:hypothetical protein
MSFCRRTYGKANASCHSISGKTVVFAADLIPTAGHINQVYVMGYDTRPLLTLEEKGKFLKQCVDNEYLLFFEHDAHTSWQVLK